MIKYCLIILLFFKTTLIIGQAKDDPKKMEREVILAITLFNTYDSKIYDWEHERQEADTLEDDTIVFNKPYPVSDTTIHVPSFDKVRGLIYSLFNNKEFFNYPFDSLRLFLNIGPWIDNKFRVIYWKPKLDSLQDNYQSLIQYKGTDKDFRVVQIGSILIKDIYHLKSSSGDYYFLKGFNQTGVNSYSESVSLLQLNPSGKAGLNFKCLTVINHKKKKQVLSFNNAKQTITVNFKLSDLLDDKTKYKQFIEESKNPNVNFKMKFDGKNFVTSK